MKYQAAHHRGFSLIELMIGLAISLVGLLAIGQIMLTFSQQRNTISQTMNTQNNGVMALYLMERDLSQAGYGMMGLGCDRINYYFNGTGYYNSPYSTTNLPGASTGNIALTELPVRILSGGTGSDTIEVQYGRSTSGVPGAEIIADQAAYSSDYSIAAGAGFAVNDLFIARSGGICTLAQVTAVTSPDPSHAVGATYPVTTAISHAATPGVGYNVTVGPRRNGVEHRCRHRDRYLTPRQISGCQCQSEAQPFQFGRVRQPALCGLRQFVAACRTGQLFNRNVQPAGAGG
jgi:prepilin-type N-terminal cleavage/methylation domain-containing protein